MLLKPASLVLVAILLLGVACASSDDDATPGPAIDAATQPPDADQATDAASDAGGDTAADAGGDTAVAATANDQAESPIAAALGFDPDDLTEITNNYVRAAEELVRQCMSEAGFDYVPANVGIAPSLQRLWELESTISQEQFVEDYGFGISTLFELNFSEAGVLLFVEQILGPPPSQARSESEQSAYELALSGESIQGLDAEQAQEQAFDLVGGDAAEGSCRYFGYENAENPQGDVFDGLQSLLGDELAALDERFDNDPRVLAATAQWQTCMAADGYSYEDVDEIYEELSAATDDLAQRYQSSPETLAIFAAAIDANLSAMDAEGRQAFLESVGAFAGFGLVPALQEELDTVIVRELAIAKRDAECSDEDLLGRVRRELEQQFVEEHGDQLALILGGVDE